LFKRAGRGSLYSAILLGAALSPVRRPLLRRMVAFSQALPQQFERPLPEMMGRLTPLPRPEIRLAEPDIRRLADAVAAWHYRSPLGICLRRSLLRYHFLREAEVPVQIVFGARLKRSEEGGGIGGHAWLTLAGQPYHENPGDYEGFVIMYRYPEAGLKG
jgi:hypothetical protein